MHVHVHVYVSTWVVCVCIRSAGTCVCGVGAFVHTCLSSFLLCYYFSQLHFTCIHVTAVASNSHHLLLGSIHDL